MSFFEHAMSLSEQLIVLFLSGILYFCGLRKTMGALKFYLLNRSALKKREKKETPIKWLLYSNFKDVFPVSFRIVYYVYLIAHTFLILLCVVLYLVSPQLSSSVGSNIAKYTLYFETAVMSILYFLLFFPGNKAHFDRWIKKK
ncbi:MAG: hypothetical protein MRZ22_00140 [Oscillospiraceae bacterium]|nr:hypothetical protein [Oscillospiraceae bacterium]